VGRRKGKLGGRVKGLRVPTEWDPEWIRKMAEIGAEGPDIEKAAAYDLSDPKRRNEFDKLIEYGHARFRLTTAERMQREALQKGKSTALKQVAEAWLSRYADDAAMSWAVEMAGWQERIPVHIEKLKKHRKREKDE
jgi:hypothetical protein